MLSDGRNAVSVFMGAFAQPPSGGNSWYAGIGIDATGGPKVQVISNAQLNLSAGWLELFSEGAHYADLLVKVQAGTGVYYADDSRAGASADPALTFIQAVAMM